MQTERNFSIAKILIIIPMILTAISMISLAAAMVLEGPTNRGTVYTVFMIIVMLGLFLAPPVSIILSIIAIILELKASKAGGRKSPGILIIGIIELVLSAGGILLAIMFILAGKGV